MPFVTKKIYTFMPLLKRRGRGGGGRFSSKQEIKRFYVIFISSKSTVSEFKGVKKEIYNFFRKNNVRLSYSTIFIDRLLRKDYGSCN